MKWTYDWLKEYLDTKLSAEQIADELTRIGLEVEDLSTPIAPIAAKIVECKPVEGSDHLHVLMVDDGTDTLRQVVCGAPNARVGLISALALPGCVIAGHEIQPGKLRGVMSNGMMCSARELGISDDHSGIIELDAKTKTGSPVIDMKTVFDAGITPNRPDYLSVRGVALDLSAADAGKFVLKQSSVMCTAWRKSMISKLHQVPIKSVRVCVQLELTQKMRQLMRQTMFAMIWVNQCTALMLTGFLAILLCVWHNRVKSSPTFLERNMN